MSINDITKDKLISKPSNKAYLDNFDKIFNKEYITNGGMPSPKASPEGPLFAAPSLSSAPEAVEADEDVGC